MNEKEIKKNGGFDPVRAAAVIFCIFAAIAAAYVFFGHLFKIVLPFLLGAAVAGLATALAAKLSKHTRASSRTVSAAVLITLIASIVGALFFAIRRLISELGRLAEGFASGDSPLSEIPVHTASLLEKIGEKLTSFFPNSGAASADEMTDRINSLAAELIDNIISQVGSAVPGILTSILRQMPDLFLGLIVTVISAFYFTLDSARIKKKTAALLPISVRAMISKIKKEAAVAAFGYLKSYSLIMLITFAEIFFGLTVLGVDYSFLIAAISALIDILPVLGVGTILIPWAIFCLITQDIFRGIGLIILYVIIVIVRQFIEPKIIGENLGMHPLLALAAFYLGYKFFGFAGIFIAPLALIIWRAFGPYHSESIKVD